MSAPSQEAPPLPAGARADWPRVAHLLRPAQGGMLTQVRALLTATPGAAFLAAPDSVLDSLRDAIPDRAATLSLPPQGRPSDLLRAGVQAGRWARRQGASLVHGHGIRWAPLFAAASLAAGLPLVVTLHNLVPGDLPVAGRLALAAALARARRLICVSEAVAASARAAAPGVPGRLRVVYNGVDVARFAALPPRAEARRLLALLPEATIALCVARLSPEKDVGTFLEAAALAARTLATARFLVAGDGPQRRSLEQQVALLGLGDRATLLGARDDVPLLLAASDVFCQPSREEGLGLAAIEGMAAGLPVIATRVGGLPEVVADGETGLLTPPRDPVAFADALTALLADPERATGLGHAGRRRAEGYFSVEAMLAGTRAVYAEATRR